MRFKTTRTFLTVLVLAALSFAQTKISGTVQCSKPDQQQKIDIGDQAGHVFAINEGKCKWTKPIEIAGTQTKEDIGTGFDEINGNKSHGHGYVVGTLASGDKMHVRTQGSATMKGEAIESAEGMWSFTGGTGKLKGIKGKGTYKGKGAPDGSATYEVEGEYELPK